MKNILCIFKDLHSFIKMIDDQKYTFEYGFRWQFGGHGLDIFKDGVKIYDKTGYVSRAMAKSYAYELMLDHFLESNNLVYPKDMEDGGLGITLSKVVDNIHLGHKPAKKEIERRSKQIDQQNKTIENWNKIIEIVEKYNK